MFGVKSKKKEDDANALMQKSARGNMDEYEALRTIIAENQGLFTRVLEKIRTHRAMSSMGAKDSPSGADMNARPADQKK